MLDLFCPIGRIVVPLRRECNGFMGRLINGLLEAGMCGKKARRCVFFIARSSFLHVEQGKVPAAHFTVQGTCRAPRQAKGQICVQGRRRIVHGAGRVPTQGERGRQGAHHLPLAWLGPFYECVLVRRAAGHEMCGGHIRGMFGFFFTAGPVKSFADAKKSDTAKFGRFHRAMLERGVYLAPSQYEAGFSGLAHTEADIDFTLAAAKDAFQTL